MNRVLWSLFALVFASLASAQSLAELAKKEKERREQLGTEESQPITEFDLRKTYRGPGTTSTVTTTTEAESEESAAESPLDQDMEARRESLQTESYWRGRLAPIDQRIRRLEAELESSLYTENPRGAWERRDVEQDLADARAERQTVLNEARRAGVPPGWLR